MIEWHKIEDTNVIPKEEVLVANRITGAIEVAYYRGGREFTNGSSNTHWAEINLPAMSEQYLIKNGFKKNFYPRDEEWFFEYIEDGFVLQCPLDFSRFTIYNDGDVWESTEEDFIDTIEALGDI